VNSSDFIFGVISPEPFSTQLFWDLGIIGLVLVALQGVLALIFGHHGDLDGDVHEFLWSNYLSLKTIAAFLLGIGFGGAAFAEYGFSPLVAIGGGIGIGLALAIFFFALMRGFHKMRSDGTAQLWEAVGQRAKVYMRIPGEEAAPGEVQVAFGGRLMNISAFTRGPELPTGTDVLVISIHGGNALEVEKVSTDRIAFT
jgi:hypothetical protein